jgi:hypothetical protein
MTAVFSHHHEVRITAHQMIRSVHPSSRGQTNPIQRNSADQCPTILDRAPSPFVDSCALFGAPQATPSISATARASVRAAFFPMPVPGNLSQATCNTSLRANSIASITPAHRACPFCIRVGKPHRHENNHEPNHEQCSP